ncbi:hypothetical protein KUL97_11755 [Synechococcus sp. HK05]|uniref:hypothetical protein n=1 Tax=Synechococcus sp. HK05 TaxID=2725975 RepID=UPI001C38B993|nr:hypothetical protein [Synechococcus sp. HK05]MBV2352381.1 hypothetical protein [Synechococcus sp. HK05]
MSASRPTSTSRAYWELKAEQVMDRVFENAGRPNPAQLHHAPIPTSRQPTPPPDPEPIEVEVRETRWRWPWRRPQAWQLAATTLAGLGLLGGLGLWHGWSEARNDLRQERNLRLLEGIRSLENAPAATEAAAPGPSSDALPPPPPSEPWIEELAQLESSAPAGAPPLQVPLNGTLQAPAPPASASAPSTASAGSGTPELLGVVQIPGKPGSAIFQLGGSSTNALVGEMIGSSGWKLVSTSGDSAVIERGGASRRVSISSGF